MVCSNLWPFLLLSDTSGLQDSCRMRFSHQSRSALINQLICSLIWLKRRDIMSCNKSSSPVIKCKLLGQKKHYLQNLASAKPPHGPLHLFYGTTLITVYFHSQLYPALLSTGRAVSWGKIERTGIKDPLITTIPYHLQGFFLFFFSVIYFIDYLWRREF